jgi:periplasmic protein CpxP/Spy
MIRSTALVSAAVAALLLIPGLAQAQATPPGAIGSAATPSAAAPAASPSAPTNVEQRVEEHIRQLHVQLHITPAEQPDWDRFAGVMRENARAMDQEFALRREQFPKMNALQNMQSYEKMAEMHAQHLQKLVPAFENLYNSMPAEQKRLTDQVFREHAQPGRGRMQTGSSKQ